MLQSDASIILREKLQPERRRFSSKIKVIFISGPTATGKSKLGIRLAEKIGGEIVSCDSMQVYKGMDIGTAKVTLEERRKIPHHMIDVHHVSDPMTVVDYYEGAMNAIESIALRGKIPIVVGGAGFYMRSLLYGPPKGPPSDPLIRSRIEDEMDKFGPEFLYSKLREIDPDYAESITLQDRQKIVRALEIIMIEQKKVSEIPKPSQEDIPGHFEFLCYFIYYPKPLLYHFVDERCEQMIEMGLMDEVARLMDDGIEYNPSAMRAIAYRQAIEFLRSDRTFEDWEKFLITFKRASKNYVKRQFTWFKREKLFSWIDLSIIQQEDLLTMIASKV